MDSAGQLIQIKSNDVYSTGNRLHLIYAIHCTKTNECWVEITTIGGTTVKYPPYSFVTGAVYYILIEKMIFDENLAGFIGYKLNK